MGTATNKHCMSCGAALIKPPKYSLRQWAARKACSNGCSAKIRTRGRVKKCLKCQNEFFWRPSMRVGEHCSHRCASLGQKRTLGKRWKVADTSNMKMSPEHRRYLAALNKLRVGPLHHRWITDRTKLKKSGDSEKDRRSSACVTWRLQIRTRDGWRCKIANEHCAGRLEVHHILGWTEFPELRYELNNGITLCHAHHPRGRAEELRLRDEFHSLVSIRGISL